MQRRIVFEFALRMHKVTPRVGLCKDRKKKKTFKRHNKMKQFLALIILFVAVNIG